VGWVACRDRDALGRMERMKHYTSICGAAPSELLAQIALKARERILGRNRALIAKNLPMLEKFFAEFEELFEWYLPDGGCIGYPRYTGRDGVEEFARRLVEESGVLLLPASVYRSELGATPTDRFRIGYGRDNMEAGLAALRGHLRKVATA
jgi:aspartate/methionine/tyrosine aminotransferase